ncbi:DUF3093 domain-containing protein [Arthrobacter sp. TMS1-12-1]
MSRKSTCHHLTHRSTHDRHKIDRYQNETTRRADPDEPRASDQRRALPHEFATTPTPHIRLWDAAIGYPAAAALLFIIGIILTKQPRRTRSRALGTVTHHTDRKTLMYQPHEIPGLTPQPTKSVGQEGEVLYEERLYPSFWIWVITVGLAFVPAVIFAPIDMLIGVVASILTLVVLIFALLTSTPTIRVTPAEVRVGRATIERQYLGRAQGFVGENATAQRGTRLHGLAYLCIRGWIDGVVRVEVSDEEDKTPYWLFSSRRPQVLSRTLNDTRFQPEQNRSS